MLTDKEKLDIINLLIDMKTSGIYIVIEKDNKRMLQYISEDDLLIDIDVHKLLRDTITTFMIVFRHEATEFGEGRFLTLDGMKEVWTYKQQDLAFKYANENGIINDYYEGE